MRKKLNPGKFNSIIATSAHFPVTKLSNFKKKYDQHAMGLFLGEEEIGIGYLMRCDYVRHRDVLQTEGVSLAKGKRNKGYGIILYIHLIEKARSIGARRIYSSELLNKFSRRMWRDKLPQIYTVHPVVRKRTCKRCDCTNRRVLGYYIELT